MTVPKIAERGGMLQQPHGSSEAIVQPDFVGVVIDATVERLVACAELVAVPQPDATEVELRHPRHVAVNCTLVYLTSDLHTFTYWLSSRTALISTS